MNSGFAHIAVLGAGAVGSWFGGLLALAGHRVTLIGRAAHVHAIQQHGLCLRHAGGEQWVHPVASTEVAAAQHADLVLVCVKSADTEAAAAALAAVLQPDALVASLQNGVQNLASLQRHLHARVLPVVVYAATALPAPGVVQHFGGGELVTGPPDPSAAADPGLQRSLQALADLFGSAGVPVRMSADPMVALWEKLVVNCACNAVSALAQASYGQMAALPAVLELQRSALREAVAVAQADGQALALQAALNRLDRIAATMPGQRSSTAQDLARGRGSEIEHLNGFIVRRGAALGVATPVNQALYALVRLAETTTALAATHEAAASPAPGRAGT